MVRIRIGESWKQNPAYVTALQALAEGRARGFSPREIVDVLGIEVDGIDLAQGAAEAGVLDAMAQLLRAARELAAGPGEHRIHLQGAPVEMLLERGDADLRLTLLATDDSAPPVSVLVDPRRFFAAARRATHLFVDDLQAIHPRLGEMRVIRELLREANRASRRQRPVVRRARQRTLVEAPLGRLSLVVQGPPPRLAVLGPEGQTCWMETVEPGKALLRLARAVRHGLSLPPAGGERLPSGLVVDPARQILGFGRYDVPAEQVARALLTLAPLVAPILPAGLRSTVNAAVQALAEPPPDGPTLLPTGDLGGGEDSRILQSLTAPGPRNRSRAVRAPGLPSAGLRRLFLRASWRADAPGRSPRLIPCGSSLLVAAGGRVDMRSISGELKWSAPLHDARVVTLGGHPRVVGRDTQGALVLLDPRTGNRVFRAALTLGRLRDACPIAGDTLAVHDDSRLALIAPDGQVAWSLDGGDGGFRIAAAGKGLVLADERGVIRGLDASGRVEWRCRTGLDPLVSLVVDRTHRAVIAAGLDSNGYAMLVSASLADGALRWSVVQDGVRPAGLTLAGSRVLLGYESLAGSLLAAVSAKTGLLSWSTRPPGDGTALPAVMPGSPSRILVVRSGGGLCAYSPAGKLQYHSPAADPEPSLSPVRPRPLAVGAGLAVSTGALLHVYEAASGRLLTTLEPYDLAPEAVLLLDGPVVVCAGRDGSLVEAWSARGHLGVAPSLPS